MYYCRKAVINHQEEIEVTKNEENSKLIKTVRKEFNINNSYIPLTIIGEETIVGFSDSTETTIESIIANYINDKEEKKYDIPILGEITGKDTKISLVAIILGFIDEFRESLPMEYAVELNMLLKNYF